MAIPTIPTSFVPHSASAAPRRFRSDLTGAFGIFSYIVLGVVFVLAIGVFFYGRILVSTKETKDAELADAQSKIDSAAVESFIRLRDRLKLGETLLTDHVAFSGFFSSLEKIIPTSVRFTSMHLSRSDSGISTIEGAGVAKSFNALAAASKAFAADGRIKDAIFSNINVNKNNSVSFVLSATLDQKLIVFAPTAISTATSSTPLP